MYQMRQKMWLKSFDEIAATDNANENGLLYYLVYNAFNLKLIACYSFVSNSFSSQIRTYYRFLSS